jgi:hypothetical protein
MPFAIKSRNPPQNLPWTNCYGWSRDQALHNIGEI